MERPLLEDECSSAVQAVQGIARLLAPVSYTRAVFEVSIKRTATVLGHSPLREDTGVEWAAVLASHPFIEQNRLTTLFCGEPPKDNRKSPRQEQQWSRAGYKHALWISVSLRRAIQAYWLVTPARRITCPCSMSVPSTRTSIRVDLYLCYCICSGV